MRISFFHILLVLGVILLSSCNNEVKDTPEPQIAVTDSIPKETVPEYMYVTAVSGLTLRKEPNLQSDKLTVMPLGSKIKLISHKEEATMNVGGIDGAMDEVEFDGKSGFVFNGFISKYIPTGENAIPKNYFDTVKNDFPNLEYSETTGGTASKPTKTETIILPTAKWHEGFFLAQQLYGIPRQFAFPNPKGPNNETQQNSNKKKDFVTSELHITRSANNLQKIIYRSATTRNDQSVTITKEGDKIKIEKVEEVK